PVPGPGVGAEAPRAHASDGDAGALPSARRIVGDRVFAVAARGRLRGYGDAAADHGVESRTGVPAARADPRTHRRVVRGRGARGDRCRRPDLTSAHDGGTGVRRGAADAVGVDGARPAVVFLPHGLPRAAAGTVAQDVRPLWYVPGDRDHGAHS